ncbi:hypothetical protein [Nocardioides nematodiphilus]|uniref:hypothetical protein n=1 Tax=Nocardioides nematodiphilus TaxID=2849669 RepID=UPI001CD9F57F|nr:hypothetical protein [Nocardioides nematodiphilus]MCA1984792.1 hypothetical protein [Nocardioides nematodiphilus]
MTAKPVKVAYLADTSDLRASLAKAEAAMDSSAATARTAGQKIDTAFSSTAEHADTVASKGSQAAGALSGLGDLVGGKFGAAMVVGGTAMQGFADAGDLVNVVTESAIVKKIKDAAVTTVQTAKNIAAAAAQKTVAAATKAWALAQRALNLVMAANPIGLVITAIALLAAGLVLAYKKSETFRNIVDKAFSVVKAAGQALWNGLRGAFESIKSALSSVGNIATTVKNKITGAFDGAINYIKGVPGRIRALGANFKDAGSALMGKIIEGIKNAAGFVSGIATSIWNAVKGMINGAIDHINSALEFTIHIPAAPDVTINPPNIPHLANGGVTTGPTYALIGDNPGGREAVIPLDKYDIGGSTTYNITVNAPVGSSSADIGRELTKHIAAYERQGGRRRAA